MHFRMNNPVMLFHKDKANICSSHTVFISKKPKIFTFNRKPQRSNTINLSQSFRSAAICFLFIFHMLHSHQEGSDTAKQPSYLFLTRAADLKRAMWAGQVTHTHTHNELSFCKWSREVSWLLMGRRGHMFFKCLINMNTMAAIFFSWNIQLWSQRYTAWMHKHFLQNLSFELEDVY